MAIINGDSTDETLTGTTSDDTINGMGGADVISGLAGNDILIGGDGIDTLTGGLGDDIFATDDSFLSNLEAQLHGDTITDFSLGDLITFNAGFNFVDSYDFTNNGDGTGYLTMAGGAQLNFTGLSTTDDMAVISSRLDLEEVRMLDNGVLDLTLDHDYFDFYVDVERANITIGSTITIGQDTSGGIAGGALGRMDLDGGLDYTISNAGTIVGGMSLQTNIADITNTGSITQATSAISLTATSASATSDVTILNSSALSGFNGLVVNRENPLDSASFGYETVAITNNGAIEAYFTASRVGASDTLSYINNGTIQVIDNPSGGAEASQGVLTYADTTLISNSGVIEVLSDNGGFIGPVDGVAVSGSAFEGTSFTLTNSGRISSTGDAIRVGGQFNEVVFGNPSQFVSTITNTATGIIEADTNNDMLTAEHAIAGSYGQFVSVNEASATIETLNRFNIDNDGMIDGSISLYTEDYFNYESQVFFTTGTNMTGDVVRIARIFILDVGTFDQDLDSNGDPVNDGDGNPIFTTPAVSPQYGALTYTIDYDTNIVSVFDANGDPLQFLPDQLNIDDGAFDDVIDNDGTISSFTETGIGDDSVTNTGVMGDVFLGSGDDVYALETGGTSGTIDGGTGVDTADYSGYGFAIWADMQSNGPDVYTRSGSTVTTGTWTALSALSDVENIVTTAFQDVIFGNAVDNVFGFVDTIAGGFDRFDGRAGSDTIDFSAYGQAVWVNLNYNGVEAWTRGGASVLSGTWDDIANLVSVENVTATGFQDQIFGSADDNVITYVDNAGAANAFDRYSGGAGDDTADFSRSSTAVWVDLGIGNGIEAWTRGGTDVLSGIWERIANLESIESLVGSDFNDQLFGDGGANMMTGGAGDDLMSGGAGADSFVFDAGWGDDTITDFADGTDLLDLSALGITFGDLTLVNNGSGDAVITLGSDSLTLTGIDASFITDVDFIF